MTDILSTFRNSVNVLVYVDTAGRVLELLAHIVDCWSTKDSCLLVFYLALLNNVAFNVMELSSLRFSG